MQLLQTSKWFRRRRAVGFDCTEGPINCPSSSKSSRSLQKLHDKGDEGVHTLIGTQYRCNIQFLWYRPKTRSNRRYYSIMYPKGTLYVNFMRPPYHNRAGHRTRSRLDRRAARRNWKICNCKIFATVRRCHWSKNLVYFLSIMLDQSSSYVWNRACQLWTKR